MPRLHNIILVATVAYLTLIAALYLLPWLQASLVYLNWVRIPWNIPSTGESLGFRTGTLRTFVITTPDNYTLGAWHILPKRLAPLLPTTQASTKSLLAIGSESPDAKKDRFERALKHAKRVFLYLHGNAGNRATFKRPHMYKVGLERNSQCRSSRH